MKNLLLNLLVFALSFNFLNAQTCLPDGITFTTQSQIDSFAINYPDCSKILGSVIIGTISELDSSDVNNLNGLNSIQVIGGSLTINNTQNLYNLDGLESLDSIGTIIDSNGSYGGLLIGGWGVPIFFTPNDSLYNLDGLINLTHIGGVLYISLNPLLEDLEGLINLTSINGQISIYLNNSLTSLEGLQNIEEINGLSIFNNPNLSYCEVASVCNYLELNPGEVYLESNALGCISEEEVLLACGIVGLSEVNPITPLSIYPNPNQGFVSIKLDNLSDVSIRVYSVKGQLLYSKEKINSPLFQFELDAVPDIYILEIETEDQLQRVKLIKE